jgi:hypothetical protein
VDASAPYVDASAPYVDASAPVSQLTPQQKHEQLLNQVLESTSKILAILMPIAEKYAKRRSEDSGPRGFGNMTRRRNGMSKKRNVKPLPAAKPLPVVSDDAVVANTPTDETPVDETPTNVTPTDETPTDETPVDDTPVNNSSQEGGSRKKNKKSKGKKSRRSRR